MPSSSLLRLAGVSAIVAGVLRAVAAFIPYSATSDAQEAFYFVIDVAILFGVLGVYLRQHAEVGRAGFVGFVLALIGTAILVGPDAHFRGVSTYAAGAGALSIGLVVFSLAAWRGGTTPRLALVSWIVSAALGVGGFAMGGFAPVMAGAGLAFGVGFVSAGVALLSGAGSQAPAR